MRLRGGEKREVFEAVVVYLLRSQLGYGVGGGMLSTTV